MDFKPVLISTLQLSIFMTVLSIGLNASPQNATYMFRHPRAWARSLIPMSLIMPVIAVALVMVFDLNPAVKVALVALSLSPVPPILPRRILKAGGREDYTIGLLTAASVLSVILIPLALRIIDPLFPASLHMPAGAALKVVAGTILVPMAIGIGFRALAPGYAAKAAGPVGMAGIGLLVLALVPVLFGSFPAILSLIGGGTLIALIAFSVLGLFFGHLFGQGESGKQIALAFCSANRHPAMAMAIATANFPSQPKLGAAILLYVLVTFILSSLYLTGTKYISFSRDEPSDHDAGNRLRPA